MGFAQKETKGTKKKDFVFFVTQRERMGRGGRGGLGGWFGWLGSVLSV